MKRLLCFLILLPALSASAQLTVRYRYQSVGGAKRDSIRLETGVTALLTLSRHDSAGGVVCHAAIDSLAFNGQSDFFKENGVDVAVATRKGNSFDVFAKGGEIHVLGPPRSLDDGYVAVLAHALAPLFEGKPPLKPGESRTDTTFRTDSIPERGSQMMGQSKEISVRHAVTVDSMTSVVRVVKFLDDGGTMQMALGTSTSNHSRKFERDVVVSSYTDTTLTDIVSLPFHGFSPHQAVEITTLIRVP